VCVTEFDVAGIEPYLHTEVAAPESNALLRCTSNRRDRFDYRHAILKMQRLRVASRGLHTDPYDPTAVGDLYGQFCVADHLGANDVMGRSVRIESNGGSTESALWIQVVPEQADDQTRSADGGFHSIEARRREPTQEITAAGGSCGSSRRCSTSSTSSERKNRQQGKRRRGNRSSEGRPKLHGDTSVQRYGI
jgi:hypothetical protein